MNNLYNADCFSRNQRVILRQFSINIPELNLLSILKSFIMADKYNENGKIITGPSMVVVHEESADEKFKPKGAVAFFVLLILICAVIWFGIYYIQLSRQ